MARHLAGAMRGESGRDPDKLFGTGTLHPEEGIELGCPGPPLVGGRDIRRRILRELPDRYRQDGLLRKQGLHPTAGAVPARCARPVRWRRRDRHRAGWRGSSRDPDRRDPERLHDRGRPGVPMSARVGPGPEYSMGGHPRQRPNARTVAPGGRVSTCRWTTRRPPAIPADGGEGRERTRHHPFGQPRGGPDRVIEVEQAASIGCKVVASP